MTLLFLNSCEKDQKVWNDITLTSEIDKVVTLYQEGDVKLENIVGSDYKKVETEANDLLKEKIRLELEKSNSKQKTFLKSGSNPVGIIKATPTCGVYPELKIFMDSEDSNCQTSHLGNIGSCIASTADNGNITLYFCLVDAIDFDRKNFDYAVLDFGGNIPYNANGLTRVLDNEDSSNKNLVKLNGTIISGYYGGSRFYYDTQLAFYYYVADPSKGSALPIFSGISQYMVFGKAPVGGGASQNSIYSDDEDGSNLNSLSTVINVPINSPSSISNIVEVGLNTRLHLRWNSY